MRWPPKDGQPTQTVKVRSVAGLRRNDTYSSEDERGDAGYGMNACCAERAARDEFAPLAAFTWRIRGAQRFVARQVVMPDGRLLSSRGSRVVNCSHL